MARQRAVTTSKPAAVKHAHQASRTVTARAAQVSVKHDAGNAVTPVTQETPAKRHAELEPVFALANLGEKDFPTYDETDRALGETAMRLMEDNPDPGPMHEKFGGWPNYQRALAAYHAALAPAAVKTLRRVLDAAIALNPPATHKRTPTIGYIRVAIAVERGASGQLTIHRGEMLTPYLNMLEGAVTQRIARCRICSRYFYATRLVRPKGSTTAVAPDGCPLHAQAARAKRYRANHDRYHHRRKMRGAGVEP
jgi:hypothetical protein